MKRQRGVANNAVASSPLNAQAAYLSSAWVMSSGRVGEITLSVIAVAWRGVVRCVAWPV